jgi:type III secretion protein T
MESFAALASYTDKILLLALVCARIASAFLLMPLFSTELVPAMVRNSMVIAFAVLALEMQPPVTEAMLSQASVPMLLLKEISIGCAMGLFFGTILWAFEAAGTLIDTKIGSTQGQLTDPMSGQQVPITGAFLGRLANFVFMFSGGMTLFIGTLLESYALWPVMSFQPSLAKAGIAIVEAEFGRLMLLTLMLTAPIIVVLYAVDGVLGLVNRYAPQLNLFSLAGSLKTWIAIAMMFVLLGSMIDQLMAEIQSRPGVVLRTLKALMGVPGS